MYVMLLHIQIMIQIHGHVTVAKVIRVQMTLDLLSRDVKWKGPAYHLHMIWKCEVMRSEQSLKKSY